MESTTWDARMRKEVRDRESKCALAGMNNTYQPGFDPFVRYRARFEDFMKEHPFKLRSHCKAPANMNEKDKLRRMYVNVKNVKLCDKLKGVWDPRSTSRTNFYEQGVCWTNPDDAHCGSQYESPGAMRKELKALTSTQLKERSRKCVADPKCTWVRAKQDCLSKKAVEDISQNVMDPPLNMPKDVTREGAEAFLYDWYMRRMQTPPPATTSLQGTGNRCTGAAAAAAIPDVRNIDRTNRDQLQKLVDLVGRDPLVDLFRLEDESKAQKIPLDDDIYQTLEDMIAEQLQQKMALSLPQSVVNMVMKNMARVNNSNRGMLAWHSTGSGKTCTATAVMEAFWDTDRDIVFASSLDAIASNPDYKFHECAMRFFPRFNAQDRYKGRTPQESMQLIGEAFAERGVRFLSFAKLANRVKKTEDWKMAHRKAQRGGKKGLHPRQARQRAGPPKPKAKPRASQPAKPMKRVPPNSSRSSSSSSSASTTKKIPAADFVDLDKCILIIDEVHNLFRPLATQKQQHEYLESHLVDPRRHPNMKIVILTATPGDNVADVLKLLNIIRDPTHGDIKAPNPEDANDVLRFKQDIRGMISYFDMSNDRTKFPVVVDQEPVKYPMSMKQFSKYVEVYKETGKKKTHQDYDRLAKANQLNKFWQGARRYSNMLYSFEKDMMLHEFSAKLPALLENIKSAPNEKHYVYSAFYENRNQGYGSQGILAIANFLQSRLGYKKMTVAEAKRLNAANQMPTKEKRFILAVTKEIGEEGSAGAGKNLHQMIRLFNHSENKNGDYIHVFLASQGFNEGIDLKAVRHIHIFEPLVTMASDKQTLGRAARYCSHADLDQTEWTVQIHRYMSEIPTQLVRPNLVLMKNNQQAYANELHVLNMRYDEAKASKTVPKDELKDLKATVEAKKKQVKELETQLKKVTREDTEAIQNIDAFIYEESRRRMRDLFTVYTSMKEAAIDCRLLAPFHGQNDLRCAF